MGSFAQRLLDLLLGTAAVGVFQSFAQFYALAAADSVSTEHKARAVSSVMAGGVIAAVLGPALAAWSKTLLPKLFAGSYLMVALLGAASALLIGVAFRDRDPVDAIKAIPDGPARDLRTVFSQPISRAALANNVIGGGVMMFVMTAAPLTAVLNHHSIDDGAGVIQWHLVGMYAPSLFAGRLIDRFGMAPVLFSGMLLTTACVLVASVSSSLIAFYIALLCLGVGWNLMYVGGTTLLASSYQPHERARVQGTATLIRYGFSAIATLAAGPVLEAVGWGPQPAHASAAGRCRCYNLELGQSWPTTEPFGQRSAFPSRGLMEEA
jgi:MFS family permease